MIHAVFEYLRNRQSQKILFFHIIVLLSVISQIAVSNFIGFTDSGEISRNTLKIYGTWTHIITGLTLLPVASVFALLVIREHGFRYFFPYLFGDLRQLKSDINNLKSFELPEPEAGGLAAIVESLGLGALFLVLLSGLTWFLSWEYNAWWSHDIKELHEFFTGLIEVYIIGHGSIGLLHIYLSVNRKDRILCYQRNN